MKYLEKLNFRKCYFKLCLVSNKKFLIAFILLDPLAMLSARHGISGDSWRFS